MPRSAHGTYFLPNRGDTIRHCVIAVPDSLPNRRALTKACSFPRKGLCLESRLVSNLVFDSGEMAAENRGLGRS